MSRELKTAKLFVACLAAMTTMLLILPRSYGERGISVAVISSGLVWATGFLIITAISSYHARKQVTEDERDRLISYKATFIGSMAGYLGMLIGITIIHSQYAMNGVFTLPIDTLYIFFALVLLTFGTIRELAVLALYRLGDI